MSEHSDIDAEEKAFQDEVKQIQQWWKDSRWRNVRRPYTADAIANKRGTLKVEYPSNYTAKKLWQIVEKRFAVRSYCSDTRAPVVTLSRTMIAASRTAVSTQ